MPSHLVLTATPQDRFVTSITFLSLLHVKGADNSAADALSRIGANALHEDHTSVIDFKEMATVQQEDPELLSLQSSPSSLIFKAVTLPTSDTTIVCDTSTGVPRPFVPAKFRRTLFNSLHSLPHPGIRATQRLVTAWYVWPGINAMSEVGTILFAVPAIQGPATYSYSTIHICNP